MKIHNNFIGGNAVVTKIEGSEVYIENELRDTERDWFYWAFSVEGAEGKTLTFNLQQTRLGYFGPAISHDLISWSWLSEENLWENSFSYSFSKDENKVYFAHHLLYHPERFLRLTKELNLYTAELCKSKKGRPVPYLKIGDGKKSIILTARHHACESTGSYVLEGVLRELSSCGIEDTSVFVIPFVDYDGVIDGDQGKARAPHDHARDYVDTPLYPEIKSIKEIIETNGCKCGFDFHSPYHSGGENDTAFIVRNSLEKLDRFDLFSSLLEKECGNSTMPYRKENDHPPFVTWNQPSKNFACYLNGKEWCDIAFTLETAYFGKKDCPVSEERLISFGRAFARALKKYLNRET